MKSLHESVITKEGLRCKMKKRILLLFIFFFLIIGAFIFWKLFLNKPNENVSSVNREQALPTEQFIINHLMTEDGMIRTNFAAQKDGELFLSESNGLWLQYLTLTGDTKTFTEAYETTKRHLKLKES